MLSSTPTVVVMAMEDEVASRRAVLVTALRAAGLVAVPSDLAGGAARYVRLEPQRGTLTDEINRFRGELDDIAAGFETRPAVEVMAALLGVWANLDSLGAARGHPRVQEFKARTAFYAGTLSVTLGEERNGSRWFDVGHGYAILSGDHGLKSIGHFREAIAGTYWRRKPGRVLADSSIALKEARTREQRGMAHMGMARALSESRSDRPQAVREIESALELATPNSGVAPRPDSWWTHQAEMAAALALARYGGMMGAIIDHTSTALKGLPQKAVVLRTHAHLSLADAYAADRQYEQATTRALTALKDVPRWHRQPVLLGRAYSLLKRMRERGAPPVAALHLAEGLQVMRGGHG